MRLLVVLLAFGVVACNRQGGGNGTGGEQSAGTLRAGMWEWQMRVISMEASTAPSHIQDALHAAGLPAPVVERFCLTPVQATDPVTFVRDRSVRDVPGYACQPGESVFAGGRIRMIFNCRSTRGLPAFSNAMVGTYSAERFQMAMSGEAMAPATPSLPPFPVHTSGTITGRRIGDCPAGAAN